MAHILLATPVAHIWFAKGTPSRLGLLLDLSPRNLERVLYFAQYIVTSVEEEARQRKIQELREAHEEESNRRRQLMEEATAQVRQRFEAETVPPEQAEEVQAKAEEEIGGLQERFEDERRQFSSDLQANLDELEDMRQGQLLTENRYRELRDRIGEVFHASIGAEAVLEILRNMDLEAMRESLLTEVRSTSGQRRKKAIKRLRVVEAFRKSENKVGWMILTVLPVLPPDLRPMVQLDGGRFATSDLNDLYRRVITGTTD